MSPDRHKHFSWNFVYKRKHYFINNISASVWTLWKGVKLRWRKLQFSAFFICPESSFFLILQILILTVISFGSF